VKRYTILITREDDAYLVDVPALPGCHTWGATRDEALRNAQEAVELYLEELRATGEPIPEDVAPQVASVEVAA
jgi:predicted RNase H-like HicB family nuclease